MPVDDKFNYLRSFTWGMSSFPPRDVKIFPFPRLVKSFIFILVIIVSYWGKNL